MTAIHAIEDDTGLSIALFAADGVPPAPLSDGTDVVVALDRARLRAALAEAGPVLDDAARMLDPVRAGVLGDEARHTPDDDRASGRFDHVRLDLLSE